MGRKIRHIAENVDLTSILETKVGRIRLGKIPHIWLDGGNGATDGDPLIVPSTGGTFTGDVRIEGNLHATGNITADGHVILGDADVDDITFNADVISDIIPNDTNTYDFGKSLKQWKDGFFAGDLIVGGTVDGVDVSVIKLNSMPSAADGDISASTQKITNVVNPTAAQHVATKDYVDNFVPPSGTISHDDLSDVTSDQHHAQVHAAGHIDGTDDIQGATNAQKGVATAAHITDIEANTLAKHTQGNDTTLGTQVTDLDMGGKDIDDIGVLYLGDSGTNGTYRIRINGTDLVIERRELTVWVEKFAVTS